MMRSKKAANKRKMRLCGLTAVLITALVMTLFVFTLSAHGGTDFDGSGTYSDPYRI